MPTTTPPPTNVIAIDSAQPVIRRRPGRPKEVRPAPLVEHDEVAYVEKLAELGAASIEADPVVQAMDAPDDLFRLDALIGALAREQAGLLHDRLRQQSLQLTAPDPAQLSSRRVDCLLKLARVVVQREELRRQRGLMDDETVARLVGMLTDTAVRVVQEVATPQQAAAFETSLRGQVAGASWSMLG